VGESSKMRIDWESSNRLRRRFYIDSGVDSDSDSCSSQTFNFITKLLTVWSSFFLICDSPPAVVCFARFFVRSGMKSFEAHCNQL
jgi:hypothetical protein